MGRGRFAPARLSAETSAEDSIFAAWTQDSSHHLEDELGVGSYLAEPVRSPTGILGGPFVGWRTAIHCFSSEQQRLREVVASGPRCNSR